MFRKYLALTIFCILVYLLFMEYYGGILHANDYADKNATILVLGAGMAGMRAATTLLDAGYKDVLVIEAADRIGGRVKNTKLGEYTVELGAVWVSGKGSNPIYHLTDKYNISMIESNKDSFTLRNEEGQNVTDVANTFYAKLKEIVNGVDKYARTAAKDFSLAGALKYFNWTYKSSVCLAVESYYLDYELGVPPSAHSGKYFYLMEAFEEFGNYDMLVSNHEEGLAAAIEQMSVNVTTLDGEHMLFNATVTDIMYGDDSVEVYTLDGKTFEADFAIVTFSLGVLQQREVNFVPELPELKKYAIDNFGFSSYIHAYLKFEHTFWDDTMFLVYSSAYRGRNYVALNLNFLYPGSNILQFSLYDSAADWAEQTDVNNVIAELVEALQKMYPNKTVSNPLDYAVSRWNSDPLTRGAFSYWPPGFTEEDMLNLIAPVGRLYFAGEYAHEIHYGFLHAAYLSGDRVAKQIILCIENPITCETLANRKRRNGHRMNSGFVGGVIMGMGSLLFTCMLLCETVFVEILSSFMAFMHY